MLRILIAIAAAFVVGRWLLSMRRRAAEEALPPAPGDIVEPGTLRTVALLIGPNFDEDAGDDPQSMGEPLARAIQKGLIARGYSVGDPYASSHGYEVEVKTDGAVLNVSCGIYDGDGDEEVDENEWLVLVAPPQRPRSEWLPAENTANARKLVGALRDTLAEMPGLRRVKWCADNQDFQRGVSDWHERPF